MADVIANQALGRWAQWADDGDTFMVLLLDAAEADGTLVDYDDVAALLTAGGNTEATATGYSRQTLANLSVTVDDSADEVTVDADNIAFGSIQSGDDYVKAVIYRDVDGTDGNAVPTGFYDVSITTDGSEVELRLNSAGFARAS